MEPGLLAQHVVVALAVGASAVYLVATRFPEAVRRARGRIALRLLGSRHDALRRLGRRIAPAARVNGCGGCDGCST